jgi:hypothetical protein
MYKEELSDNNPVPLRPCASARGLRGIIQHLPKLEKRYILRYIVFDPKFDVFSSFLGGTK